MEALILAGGLGTRLSSRLIDVPKSMAPVAGRPFITILLDQLIQAGFEDVLLSVGHLRHVIIESIGHSYRGLKIRYSVEETPLGTGGAIRLALQAATAASVLVLNGDTYLDADYSALVSRHSKAGRALTLAITKVDDVARYGGVLIEDDQAVGFIEKGRKGPGWINAGAYVMNRDFPWPGSLPDRFSFEADVLAAFLQQLKPAVFRCEGYFLDIGIPEDLDRAQVELAARS